MQYGEETDDEACPLGCKAKHHLAACPEVLKKSSSKLDSGSNTSQLSKNAARRLGVNGSATHLAMNLAGRKKKSEPSQILDSTLASPTNEDITKTLQVYTVTRP